MLYFTSISKAWASVTLSMASGGWDDVHVWSASTITLSANAFVGPK